MQSLYGMIDIMILGNFGSNSAVSGVNNATLVINMLTQIAIGFTVGGNILIGQHSGSKQEEDCKKASTTLFLFTMILGVIIAVLFMIFAEDIMTLLRSPALSEATTYMRTCAMGTTFIFGYNALSAVLRARGNSKKPFQVIACSTALNIALDIVFVIVFELGVFGAGLATVISQIVSFILITIFIYANREEYGFVKEHLKLDSRKVVTIVKLGFPMALQWTIASASWLVVAFLINDYGVDVSAGNGISNKIKEFCQLFISTLTAAGATMAAQNLGANEYDRAEQVMKTCMKITVSVAVFLIVAVELTAPFLVAIFIDEPNVIEHAVRNLRIEILAQIFYAGFMTYNLLATSSGDTMFVMFNSFLNCIVVRLILAIVLESVIGIDGVYIACMIAPSVSVPVGYWYYKSNKWRKSMAR